MQLFKKDHLPNQTQSQTLYNDEVEEVYLELVWNKLINLAAHLILAGDKS